MQKLLACGLLALAVGALSAPAQAVIIYSTGFEPPTFTTGELDAQDGWYADVLGSAAIQTSVVYAGSQALAIDSSPVPSSAWYYKAGAYDPIASGTPLVQASVQMRLGSVGTASGSWGLDVYASDSRVGLMYVNNVNQVYIYDVEGAAAISTGITVTRDVWHSFELIMDYANDTYYGKVDGVSTVTTNLGSQTNFSDADFRVTSAQYDVSYWDNLSVTATPEPTSLALLALGALAAARRRQ
jgi:hypothetical protein